jgi:hypothetical protein
MASETGTGAVSENRPRPGSISPPLHPSSLRFLNRIKHPAFVEPEVLFRMRVDFGIKYGGGTKRDTTLYIEDRVPFSFPPPNYNKRASAGRAGSTARQAGMMTSVPSVNRGAARDANASRGTKRGTPSLPGATMTTLDITTRRRVAFLRWSKKPCSGVAFTREMCASKRNR